jgi:VWFA-related protein
MLMKSGILSLLLVVLLAAPCAAQDGTAATPTAPTNAVTLGILVDCSGSQRLQLDNMISAVKQIGETITESDRAFMVRFVDAGKISIVQEFTNNKAEIEETAESLFIEGGQTAIIDAVDRSARYVAKNDKDATGSRVFIVISDGEDRSSGKKADETIALLKENQIKVFAIGLADLKVSTKLLDKLAKETGGKAFMPRNTSELSNAVIAIAKIMRGAPNAVK